MKLYTFCDDNFRQLEKRFIETFQDKGEIEISVAELPLIKESQVCGGYDVWIFKVQDLIDKIRSHQGEVILYTDIDIQFFKPVKTIIEKLIVDHDILFQRNPMPSKGLINIGFMVIRCSNKTLKFWQKVLARIKKNKQHDQAIVQELLRAVIDPCTWENRILRKLGRYKARMKGRKPLRFDVLPLTFWAYHGKNELWNRQMPKDIVLHHATWATTEEQKIIQMDQIKSCLSQSFPK